MILDTDLAPYLVLDEESVRHVLAKIDLNDEGMVVCVDGAGVLLGLLTDGDLRRWMLTSQVADLEVPVGSIVDHEAVTASVNADPAAIGSLFDSEVRVVPLVDDGGRCVALAWPRGEHFAIAGRRIGRSDPCLVVAEIGNNHNGDLDLAFRLIDECVAAGADCIKFQMRDLSTLYTNAGDADDYQEDLGSQYTLDLLSRYQLSSGDMAKALDRVKEAGAIPLATPWDLNSLGFLVDYGVPAVKVASADLTNVDFLSKIASYGLPVICSTGMSTEEEIRQSVGVLRDAGAQFSLLHCNSTYPAPFKDVNLRYMDRLRELGDCPVGYSSHDRGIAVSIGAVALGADILEKHVTLDKEMEGNDHRVSLLPDEFAAMVAGIHEVELAYGHARPRQLSQGELMNRESLGKSLTVNVDLSPGDIIERKMLLARSPGGGLSPNQISEVAGSRATREIPAGGVLYPSDLGVLGAVVREYRFDRPFGLPVRYHDLSELVTRTNLDFVEFHLSYKDLQLDESEHLDVPLDLDYVVHAPELFEGDHILDLASLDEGYREASIAHLVRVVELTRRLSHWFRRSETPRIVVNVGGFTQDAPLAIEERSTRYEIVADSLSRLDLSGIAVLPQTMPPYPWHFGGQRYQNLFVDPWEIATFCREHDVWICLDTSHSKLACNLHRWSFSDFLQVVGPCTSHLHIADASGVDGEGLQVKDGEIDFPVMGRILREVAPGASFIPEIWQGHKNDGQAFWRALELLEADL